MSSVLVINAAGRETRVALVENGHIAEFYLERKKDKGIVGNIYKGRVVRVLPGMQAAFVDIGLEKAAFLYVGDVVYDPDFAKAQFELTEGEHEDVDDVPEFPEGDPAAAAAAEAAAHGPTTQETQVPEAAVAAASGAAAAAEAEGAGSAAEAVALASPPVAAPADGALGLSSPTASAEERSVAAAAPAAEDTATAEELELEVQEVPAAELAPPEGAPVRRGTGEFPAVAADSVNGTPSAGAAPVVNGHAAPRAEARGGGEPQRKGPEGQERGERRAPKDKGRDRERRARDGRDRDGRHRDEEKAKQRKTTRIEDVLKVGQEVVVQASKDPIGTKGARLTSHISIPGRHLVFMPTVDHIGISRRISNEKERRRLREIVERLRPPGTGFIVRTVAENVPQEKLESDIRFLIEVWNQVVRRNEKRHGPGLLHPDLDLILRATRDLFASDVEKLVVDDREEYERIQGFVAAQDPALRDRVVLHDNEEPVFDAYGIEQEIKRATQRKVWLKSGGYLIMDQAEALTAIDVNSGRYVGKKSLEETITKINVEAAKEIVYQLRLRNIGGIIICDFIDMEKSQNRDKVFKTLQEALGRDKAKTNVLRISELGLVEMTRKRVRESITRVLHEDCTYCEGKGYVKTAVTVAYEIFREIRREAATYKDPVLVVNCSNDVARLLLGEERGELRHLMDRFNKSIQIKAQAHYHVEQFDIYGRASGHAESQPPSAHIGHGVPAPPSSQSHHEGGGRRHDGRRHEGGRGGRDRDRGGRGDRERSARGDRGDRQERGERGDRGDRQERGERGDRQERGDRGDRQERGDRPERGERQDRGERGGGHDAEHRAERKEQAAVTAPAAAAEGAKP